MPGSADFWPQTPSLGGPGSTFAVCRYDRASGQTQALPNILPLDIVYREGPIPPTATFAYLFDSTDPSSPFPVSAEEVWSGGASGPYIVQPDDELLVYEFTPSGEQLLVFDGFADIPHASIQADSMAAAFSATGVAIRLWDQPIDGRNQRQGDDPQNGDFVETDLPCWFNPDGRANCTPDGYALNEGLDDETPLFLDELLPNGVQTSWDLVKFAQYMLWFGNPDEEYINNPSSQDLAGYLVDIAPLEGAQYYDLANPATYQTRPIVISSYNATNKLPIDALAEQLHHYGFELFFALFADDNGLPINELIIYRKDGYQESPPVQLGSLPYGADLSQGVPDYEGLELSRGGDQIVNEFAVESSLVEVEASFILAPGFQISGSDASNVNNYDSAKLVSAAPNLRRAYRWFVFDEAGAGHWDFGSSSWISGPGNATSLDTILGAPQDDEPQYVRRMRPGLSTLVSEDSEDRPYKADLSISQDYAGTSPGIWDGTGTWRTLGNSGWRLLTDRLGIEITAPNPDNWVIPKNEGAATWPTADVVHVIQCMANPNASGSTQTPRFFLRLTCRILADVVLPAVATRRDASPTRFTVRRRLDAREAYKGRVVDSSSINNQQIPPADNVVRNDTDAALAKAEAYRAAHEFPRGHFEIRVPWITHALGVGSFVAGVPARGLSFGLGDGGGGGESPHYPVVTQFAFHCQEPQQTVFTLSDERPDPERPNARGRRDNSVRARRRR